MTNTLHAISCAVLCVAFAVAVPSGRSQQPAEPATPRIFAPGEISVGDFESHPAFADGDRTLYFLKSNLHFTWWTIVVSHLKAGSWTTPEVAQFSGRYSDADPFVTVDGSRLFFISNRPDGEGTPRDDMDVWMMERAGEAWGSPKRLPAPINSAASEWFPVLTDSGMLYFGSSRPGGRGRTDIYRCAFKDGTCAAAPENLGEQINTALDEFEAFVTPDERLMILMSSGRADSLGAGDLYISTRTADGWSPARNLGAPINSRALEIGPHVSRDGKRLFLSSARATDPTPAARRDYAALVQWLRGPGNGQSDIYEVALPRPGG